MTCHRASDLHMADPDMADPDMALKVKICGLTRPEDVALACRHGAAFLGFIFYPPSPRALAPAAAGALMREAARGVARVGIFVDAEDSWIDAVLAEAPVDILQLHGAETPERCAALKARTGCRIVKAVAVAEAGDVARHEPYLGSADMILFDARPPREAGAIPGGNGLRFDWRLLERAAIGLPWLLAGGIHAGNIEAAVRLTGARMVDVSSGVEAAPGRKDPAKLKELLDKAAHIRTYA